MLPPPPLSIEEMHVGGDVVLVLAGAIDIANVGRLRAAAHRFLPAPPGRLMLDFAGVTFCDSQGLGTLVQLHREMAAAGSRLVLANVGTFMARLLRVSGLDSVLDVAS